MGVGRARLLHSPVADRILRAGPGPSTPFGEAGYRNVGDRSRHEPGSPARGRNCKRSACADRQVQSNLTPRGTWVPALAVLFAAAHRAIEARLKNRTIAAMLSVLIVVVPALLVTGRLVDEAAKGAVIVQTQVEAGVWRRLAEAPGLRRSTNGSSNKSIFPPCSA